MKSDIQLNDQRTFLYNFLRPLENKTPDTIKIKNFTRYNRIIYCKNIKLKHVKKLIIRTLFCLTDIIVLIFKAKKINFNYD